MALMFACGLPPILATDAEVSSSDGMTSDEDAGGVSSPRAFVVLDGSGSMWGKIDGEIKIQLAKQAVGDLLDSLDPRIQLGLIAYGNTREKDCSDISTLVSVGQVDRDHFRDIVDGIVPRGRTPLSGSIESAARQLDFTQKTADIILLSDGLETCDRDPCATAASLAEAGAGLRIHVIAFDLTTEEEQTLSCISKATGGAFLAARDAGSLKDALTVVLEEVVEATPLLPAPEPVPLPDSGALDAQRFVSAGAKFEVLWSGPDGINDYVTIVVPDSPDGDFDNYVYTSIGNPAELIAAIDPGEYELRYVVPRTGTVLARRPITVVKSGTRLWAPEAALPGADIEVAWTGPGDHGDYITIVPATASRGAYEHFQYARSAERSVTLQAPGRAGSYEIRYVSRQLGRVLAEVPIAIEGPGASLNVPEGLEAGLAFEVAWSGPGQPGDYIAIVEPDAPNRMQLNFAYVRGLETAARLRAPNEPGSYEVRYALGRTHEVLARVLVKITSGIIIPTDPPGLPQR